MPINAERQLRTGIVNGHLRDHLTSRHRYFSEQIIDAQTGDEFPQGDVFPEFIKDNGLSRLGKIAWAIFSSMRGSTREGYVVDRVGRSDGSEKGRVRFTSSKYGVKEVKIIVKNGKIVSLTPNRTVGKSRLIRNGVAQRKAAKHNRSLSPNL